MKNTLRGLACLLPTLLFLPLFSLASGKRAEAPAERPKADNEQGFAGSASCSGRGCHGAVTPNNPPAIAQNEFASWARFDPHAHAFDVLKDKRAQQMAENLAPTNKDGKVIPAAQDPRCLGCHSTPDFAEGTTPEMRAWQGQGISCETCHGPALKGEGWLTAHTSKEWQGLDVAAKAKVGMKPLGDPQVQAQVCIGCHVGSGPDAKSGLPARDLNHDLMAAGHPRLTFEMSSYFANLPPHWRHDKYKNDYAAKLWAVGRAEAAQASLDLLEHRAKHLTKPWPEYAEADCFACHSNLRPIENWRKRTEYRAATGRKAGTVPYSSWFLTGIPELAKAAGEADEPLRGDIKALTQVMNKAFPDRATVVERAGALKQKMAALSGKAASAVASPEKNRELRKALATVDEQRLAGLSWDEATQLVYGLAALDEAAPDVDQAKRTEVAKQFEKVYALLAFPLGFESPMEFRRADATLTSDRLTAELKELVKLLGTS